MRTAIAIAACIIVSGCQTTGVANIKPVDEVRQPPNGSWLNVSCEIVVQARREECIAAHKGAGVDPYTAYSPDALREKILAEQHPQVASAQVTEPPKASADSLGDDQWGDVRCDLVSQDNRSACIAAHVRLGIASDTTLARADIANQQPAAVTCGFAMDGYRPMLDLQGQDASHVECDLAECQAYAAQISPAKSAVANAVGGAILGALFGLAVGDHGWAARAGAQGGAIGGAISGAGNAVAARVDIVRNCMAGRGYRVLQ